jgi:hypothetical protein
MHFRILALFYRSKTVGHHVTVSIGYRGCGFGITSSANLLPSSQPRAVCVPLQPLGRMLHRHETPSVQLFIWKSLYSIFSASPRTRTMTLRALRPIEPEAGFLNRCPMVSDHGLDWRKPGYLIVALHCLATRAKQTFPAWIHCCKCWSVRL